jgi:hypothetical protein
MDKLECCQYCDFYAHSAYMVCGVHPTGVEGNYCADFRVASAAAMVPDDPLVWYGNRWQPQGASYYGDEPILEPVQRRSSEHRLELLDSHPLFTGRCPQCERGIKAIAGQIHYDCENCGWVDDSM